MKLNESIWIFFLDISCSGSNVSLNWYHNGSIVNPALTADPALTPYYPTARAGVKYMYVLSNTNTNTFFSGVSNTNTNTNTPAKIWSNTNTNTNTAYQIQIQIQIHNEAETKLSPFYRWHIKIYCIVRRSFYLFKFHWKLFPKVQSTISLHWFR